MKVSGQTAADLSYFGNNAILGTSPDPDASDPEWVPANILILGAKDDNSTAQIPAEYNLSQNYPNPFNPETIINYQLTMNNYVTIKVYDILGREVATLVNEEKPAGKYSLNFDASKLSSGIYFYRIKAGSFTQTRKMILLR